MKYIVPLILIGCIATIVYAAVSPAPPKLICPMCKKEIEKGQTVAEIYTGTGFEKVHFSCAFKSEMQKRLPN